MSKNYVKGKLLPEPQEVFEPVRHNWSTLIAIEGEGTKTDSGYHGVVSAPYEALQNPAIVVRTGYAQVRAVFILKKNITEQEWKDVAMEAMSRPECGVGPEGTGEFGISKRAITKVYKGITNISEYPFPMLKPAFCLEEMYQHITFTCGIPGPCQRELDKVAGRPGAACKPGDHINYSICASMPCNCNTAREHHSIVQELEKLVPTRHQLMLMQKFENDNGLVDSSELLRRKRSEAAKKGWASRRARNSQDIRIPE